MEQAGDAYAQGDLSEAERICLESLVAAPDDPQIHHQLALVYAGQGRAEEALAALDRALAIQPGNFDLLMLRGDMLMALKRFSEALACFDRGDGISAADAPLAAHPRQCAEGAWPRR